jgi:excisionase family DNA binding protein
MRKTTTSDQFDFEAWLTPREAAELIGVTAHQVRHLARSGALEARRFGHAWMLKRTSVEEYAASERRPGPRPMNSSASE